MISTLNDVVDEIISIPITLVLPYAISTLSYYKNHHDFLLVIGSGLMR